MGAAESQMVSICHQRATLLSTQLTRYFLCDRCDLMGALQFDFSLAALILKGGIAHAMAGRNPEPFKNPTNDSEDPTKSSCCHAVVMISNR